MRRGPLFFLLLGVRLAIPLGTPLLAQQDSTPLLKVTPSWLADRYRDGDELIELTLERPLGAGETLAMVIGTLDVTHLTDVRPTTELSGLESSATDEAVTVQMPELCGLDHGSVLPRVAR